jgi:MscS family membrane protein
MSGVEPGGALPGRAVFLLRLSAWVTVATLLLATPTAVEAETDSPPHGGTAVVTPTVDLSSPREAMFTFLRAMGDIRAGRNVEPAWAAVLETFATPAGTPRDALEASAHALLDSLDRLGTVQPAQLPDAEAARRAGINRFEYFPHAEHAWVYEALKDFNRWPTGQIVLVDTDTRPDAAAWRFSERTVRDAVALAESLSPLPPRHVALLNGEEPVLNILGAVVERTIWWGWLALLGCIFMGLLAGKIAAATLRGAAIRLRNRGWTVRAIAFDSLANPASLALLTLGLAIGLHSFIYLNTDLATFVNQVIQFLYLLAVGWALYNLVDTLVTAIRMVTDKTPNKLDDMIVPLIRKTLRVFIVVVFFLVVAQNVFGVNITGWLAGLGIAGLAVSLAAQDSVKNLFGSITVFFDKPFIVGDVISFNNELGIVEEIGFRSTRLRLLTGHLMTIPNMQWIDNSVENITARRSIRRIMDITITYDTPPDKIEEAVRIVKEVLTDPKVVEEGGFNMDQQPPRVAFDELNSDSLNIKAFYWYQLAGHPTHDFFTYLNHCQLVNLMLFRRFEEAGIDFAFPTQTIHLANDDKRQLAVRMLSGGSDGPIAQVG